VPATISCFTRARPAYDPRIRFR